jgi:nifR3 family TIM-barrel protein
MNFWQQLPTPIFVLAPMADVTDAPFRRMIAKYSAHTRKDGTVGGPDVMWTEFVAADGLVRATPEGKKLLLADLMYSEEERPIVAQLFTSNPDHMEQAARLCLELGFDGVDINMGCPDKSIEKQGCGSAMIKNPDVAQAVIRAAKKGARSDEEGGIPVSVKTRLGYNKDELEEWLPAILQEEPAALILHARTRKDMSKVPARWERVKRAVEIRNELGSKTLILGNGDALSIEDAQAKVEETGADGVMLGRAVFGNPYLFHPTKRLPERMTLSASSSVSHRTEKYDSKTDSSLPSPASQENVLNTIEIITIEERLRIMIEHTKLFVELLPFKNFSVMKKHYKAYVNSFPGASELRGLLMEKNSVEEMEEVVQDFLQHRK